jgi:hypothetical protein
MVARSANMPSTSAVEETIIRYFKLTRGAAIEHLERRFARSRMFIGVIPVFGERKPPDPATRAGVKKHRR